MNTSRLTSKILKDENALGLAIDELLLASKSYRKVTRRVRKVQREMRRKMTRDAWMIYMRLEELVNERSFIEGNLLVKWAFTSRGS